ncbi:MAG: RcnB family protein [Caulobacteraceae bacterium]|nr:RcnB family protein [Caulobacteraceae bacterium]
MNHTQTSSRPASGRSYKTLLAAAASLILAVPVAAFAQSQSSHGPGGAPHGGGPQGGPSHGGGPSGGPHGGGGQFQGAIPHGGQSQGGPAHGGPVQGGQSHGGQSHGGPAGPGGPLAPGGVYRGYDGSAQHDEHGNAGDRRGFGNDFRSSRRFHPGPYHRPQGWYQHSWRHGEILPPLFWGEDYWLMDYWMFSLSPPPYGYVWVRYGDDALLIDRATGEIVEVIYGVFY